MPFRKTEAADIDSFFAAALAKARRHTYLKRLAAAVLLAALAVWVLFGVVFEIATVRGVSMLPTLRDGTVVLAYRLGPEPKPGDVVLIRSTQRRDYIKRVIGVPGDTIGIDAETGTVIRNGEPLAEPYAAGPTLPREDGLAFPVTLGEGEYLLLGDNRAVSSDGRDWGLIDKEQIKARVILPDI